MNTANKLTLVRIIFIPIFIIAYYLPISSASYIATAIFILAFITDILDGYIARKWNIVTNFGKLLDPVADKLMMTSALVVLCASGKISAIIVIVILAREFIISGLRMVLSSDGNVLSASRLGKLKTVSQCVAVVGLLIEKDVTLIFGNWVVQFFVYLALVMTIWSCIDYIQKNWKYINFN